MSFTDRLVLWLHIGFAIFTIGPLTLAIMSTPRYVRTRNLIVLRYLYRITRIFALLALAVLILGLVLAQLKDDFSRPWLTASLTLFVVAIVFLVLIIRDQRRAITALELAAATDAAAGSQAAASTVGADGGGGAAQAAPDGQEAAAHVSAETLDDPTTAAGTPLQPASVERGRITMMGGVVSVIWLIILVLMVWNG